MPMNWCMVDIETTGTDPALTAMIQIAAVKFDPITREIDHNFFDQCLMIPPRRFWDEGTRGFWSQQKPAVLEGIYAKMRDHNMVMRELYDWVTSSVCDLHFCAKPLSFDFPFVASYFKDAELPNPFKFWIGRDLRSVINGLYFGEEPFDESAVEFQGEVHNALHDTLHQINLLFKALDAKGK